MPNIFTFMGYKIYFWSNENEEPIHVHICKGKPSPKATKLWISSTGKCLVAVNSSRIPKQDLAKLIQFIEANAGYVYNQWVAMHGVPRFYC